MIRFTLNPDRIRELCINRKWYTLGSCADYDAMLEQVYMYGCNLADFQAEELVKNIACGIRINSDIDRIKRDTGMSYDEIGEEMAHAILNTARVYFE